MLFYLLSLSLIACANYKQCLCALYTHNPKACPCINNPREMHRDNYISNNPGIYQFNNIPPTYFQQPPNPLPMPLSHSYSTASMPQKIIHGEQRGSRIVSGTTSTDGLSSMIIKELCKAASNDRNLYSKLTVCQDVLNAVELDPNMDESFSNMNQMPLMAVEDIANLRPVFGMGYP